MTEFTLDTSGAVEIPNAGGQVRRGWLWPDLSPFEQGYVEAMFASGVNGRDHLIGVDEPIDPAHHRFSDLSPETLAAIRKDCETIQSMFPNFGDVFPIKPGREFYIRRQRGNYRSHGFPPLTVTLCDDGRVYLREGR